MNETKSILPDPGTLPLIKKLSKEGDILEVREVGTGYLLEHNERYATHEELIEYSKKTIKKTFDKWAENQAIEKKEIERKKLSEPSKLVVLGNKVKELLLNKKFNEATECLVKEYEKENIIKTTRDDIKSEVWQYLDGIYVNNGATRLSEWLRKVLGKAYKPYYFNAVLCKLEADTRMEQQEFFNSVYEYEIPLKKGIFNLKTGELMPFDHNKIFFSKLNVEYDPNKKVNKILDFFKSTLDEEGIKLIQEFLGYCLMNNYKLNTAFMLLGGGSNGKSKVLELIKHFIGAENCSNVELDQLESDAFIASELFSKKVNICGDLSNKTLGTSSKFKQCTGDEQIACNRKYLRPIYFINSAKFISACNVLPMTLDLTDGFFRRWKLIDFKEKFVLPNEYLTLNDKEKEQVKIADPDILDKICTPDEISGLFNWGYEGFKRIESKGFSSSETTSELRERWIRKSNSLRAFIQDCIETNVDNNMKISEFKGHYIKYCREQGVKAIMSKVYGDTLEECSIYNKTIRVDDTTERIYENVRYNWEKVETKKIEEEIIK